MKSIKNSIFLLLLVLISNFVNSQNYPKKIKFKGEELLIYPTRTNLNAIPPNAGNLPDGKYAILHNYIFKKKFLKKKMKLHDTLKVKAVVTIKNNLAEGDVVFYSYAEKRNSDLKNKPRSTETGFYTAGLKSGTWVTKSKKRKSIDNFKDNFLNGPSLTYTKNVLTSKENYEDGKLIDTVYHYYNDGKLHYMYDKIPASQEEPEQKELNMYSFLMSKRSLGPSYSTRIKSFYISYDLKGKKESDVKFDNGKVVAVDTFVMYNEKAMITKVNSSHPDSQNYFIYFIKRATSYSTTLTKEYYLGKCLFKRVEEYYYKTKKKGYIKSTEVELMVDMDKLDMNSINDVVIKSSTRKSSSTLVHFIPALGFTWREYRSKDEPTTTRNFPINIDTVENTLFILDTIKLDRDFKAYEKSFLSVKQQNKIAEKRDYHKQLFLVRGSDPKTKESLIRNLTLNCTYEALGKGEDFNKRLIERIYVDKTGPLNTRLIEGYLYKKTYNGVPHIHSKADILDYGIGNFVNGKKEGEWNYLEYMYGQKVTIPFNQIYKYGKDKSNMYYITNYKNGMLNGKVSLYKRGTEYNEKFNYSSDSKKLRYLFYDYLSTEGNYVNDTLHGLQTEYYHNNKVKTKINYNMGKLNGTAEYFDIEGVPEKLLSFKNDLFDGEFVEYRKGKPICTANFKDNGLHGSYKIIDYETQQTRMEIVGENGILKSKKTWFTNGKIKEEIIFTEESKFEFGNAVASFNSFLETKEEFVVIPKIETYFAKCKMYYDNGQLLAEGGIEKGEPAGEWNFYNITGALINKVNFKEEKIKIGNDTTQIVVLGKIDGFFNNGKKRCKGFAKSMTTSYDCGSRQDYTKFEIIYTDVYDFDENKIIADGNGKGNILNENGLKIYNGELNKSSREGKWKMYDPDQKLSAIGNYIENKKDGIWYTGDLEGLNFEDAACFDPNDKRAQEEFEKSKKKLSFETKLYALGKELSSKSFSSNLNKEREYNPSYRRGGFWYRLFHKKRRRTHYDF